MEQLIRKFTILASDGSEHRCSEYQAQIPAGDFDNPRATLPGLKRVVTDEGHAVNVLGEGRFHIVRLRLDAVGPDLG